jgi:serine protease Do
MSRVATAPEYPEAPTTPTRSVVISRRGLAYPGLVVLVAFGCGPALARGSTMLSAVKRVWAIGAAFAFAAATGSAVAKAQTLPRLPPESAAPRAADSKPISPTSASPTSQDLYAHVRRGVVILERAGAPVAVGTVLADDGRVLTALSGLGGGESVDVLYADGTRVHARLERSDPALDLALLATERGRTAEGLPASDADPAVTPVRTLCPARGASLRPAAAEVRGHVDAQARSGESLPQMLDVQVQGSPVVGAPLLDAAGGVVAVLVRACKETSQAKALCQPVLVGAPVANVRSFLSQAGPPAGAAAPWLGIRGERLAAGVMRGVRVKEVAPSSPAERAGLSPGGDIIVAVDGQPIDTPEGLGEALGKRAVGDTVDLLVFGGGKFRTVGVTLLPSP